MRGLFGPPFRHWGGCRAQGGGRDFFGLDPKKLPPFLLGRSALCPTRRPPHPGPLSRKGRGVKDLREAVGTQEFIRRSCPTTGAGTFFWWTQKKSPFFSAPKKPKKSVRTSSDGEALHRDEAIATDTRI
jgi:hypothetical protein